jgi:hypothetical protein
MAEVEHHLEQEWEYGLTMCLPCGTPAYTVPPGKVSTPE